MKKVTFTTLTFLLVSIHSFSQTQKEPGRIPPGTNTVNQASNSRLMLLSPSDGRSFTSNDGSKPILFRWSATMPKSKETVTYRLKVWQLMQGQNSVEAMRSNQPIITKDVINITQVAISNLYTGPCKPPYLCDFIWMVEVLNTEDQSGAKNYGTGSSYTFKFQESISTDSGRKYKSYQPGKPVYGNISQSGDVGTGANSIEYELNQPKDVATGQSSGKKIEFVKIKTSDKKVWKIRKEDVEVFNPKTLICYCDEAHTIVVPCDNMESCFSAEPLEPFGPLWYLEIGRVVADDINAQLLKMGMRLKGKYKSYQPGQPVYGNISQSGDVGTEANSIEYEIQVPKERSTGMASGKMIDKDVATGQSSGKTVPTKRKPGKKS